MVKSFLLSHVSCNSVSRKDGYQAKPPPVLQSAIGSGLSWRYARRLRAASDRHAPERCRPHPGTRVRCGRNLRLLGCRGADRHSGFPPGALSTCLASPGRAALMNWRERAMASILSKPRSAPSRSGFPDGVRHHLVGQFHGAAKRFIREVKPIGLPPIASAAAWRVRVASLSNYASLSLY